MANDLNQCNFIGRLGQDVELKYAASGSAIANISLAVGSSWKNKTTGNKEEKTEWINVSAFGKLAEIMSDYLKKGSKVYISGEFTTRKYQAQDGSDRYVTSIRARDMQMLDSRGDSAPTSGSSQAGANSAGGQSAGKPPPNNTAPGIDDGPPF